MDDRMRIASVLKANDHLVLATADSSGSPWVTPVSYSFDESNSLYWVSAKGSRHSLNIKARERVAIVVYMLQPVSDALYMEAEVTELDDRSEISSAIRILHERKQPAKFRVNSVRDVTGKAAWRIYKAVPTKIYVREQAVVNDQLVTVRRQIA